MHIGNTPCIASKCVATRTVCLVPHPSAQDVWDILTRTRTELKDPGLFRWPPHVNLLYPFLDVDVPVGTPTPPRTNGSSCIPSEETIPEDSTHKASLSQTITDETLANHISAALRHIEPFTVTLRQLGTFGSRNHGVLWVYPMSFPVSSDDQERGINNEIIHDLYQNLVLQFPQCVRRTTNNFSPHLTLGHFKSKDEAEKVLLTVQASWPSKVQFMVHEVYLLERVGDDGQFQRVATVGLGEGSAVQLHQPPLRFPNMPVEEEGWVRLERMKLKKRRNGQ